MASIRTSLLALLLAGSLLPLAGLAALEHDALTEAEDARRAADLQAGALAAALRAEAALARGEDPLAAARGGSAGEEVLLLPRGGAEWPELRARIGDRLSGVERVSAPDGREVDTAWARAPDADADVVVVSAIPAPAAAFRAPFLILAAFLVAGVALLVAYVGARILAPFAHLEAASRRLARGEWDARAPAEGPSEVRALAAAFNQMAEELAHKQRELDALLSERTRSLIDREGDIEALRFTLAHEFREPLRSLRWMADDLLEQPLAADARRATLVLRRRIDDLDAVMRDLLRYEDVSRREAPMEPFPLETALRAAVDDAREVGPLRVEGDVLPEVRGNPDLLAIAFREILRNAALHAARGRAPRVWIGAERQDDTLLLRFDDDGPGIPPARREDALHLFQRLRRDVPGTGAGLAIARRAIARHDGTLTLGEAPGGGARVEVRLPMRGPSTRGDVAVDVEARRF